MVKAVFVISLGLMLGYTPVVNANERTYYLDRQNGEMAQLRVDDIQTNIQLSRLYTNNYFYENINKDTTQITEITPTLVSQFHTDDQMLQLGVWSKYRIVERFPEDDTFDIRSLVKYHQKLTHNQSLVFSSAYFSHHLDRGLGLSQGIGEELTERDHQRSYFVNVAHQLGTDDSNARLISLMGYRSSGFENREVETSALDLSAIYMTFDFQYYLSGNTFLLAKLAFEDINHDIAVQQDRRVSSLLTGLKWHKNDFTHFEASIGALQLMFDDGLLADKTDFKWDLNMRWSPQDSLEFNIFSIRSIDENRQVDNSFLIRDKFGINATYQYSDSLQFFWQNSFDNFEFFDEMGNFNEQALLSNITVYFDITDKVGLSLSYQYQSLDALLEIETFQRNFLSLGVNFAI